MMAHVHGTLDSLTSDGAVVETAGGLGFTVLMPRTTRNALPDVGSPVKLLTHLIVREDQWQLCGFLTEAERAGFLALLAVTGVGPKVALLVVGHLTPNGLIAAVRQGRWQLLREVPGVGPKLAQRMLVELKTWAGASDDDMPWGDGSSPPVETAGPEDEVVESLQALGLSRHEALAAVVGLDGLDSVERLREALRRMDRGKGVG